MMSTYRQNIALDALILDPALQARVAISITTVAEYAAKMKEPGPEGVEPGGGFPALDVVLVGDRHLVTDGWHRLLSARQACADLRLSIVPEDAIRAETLGSFPCNVTPGTWLDAVKAAAAANPRHGLPRTHEDKRRAVRMLLMQSECCGMSSRELAPLAGVTHTHVQDVRRRYGLEAGMLLTEEHQCQVDGEMSPRWKAAYHGLQEWQHRYLDPMRIAPDVRTLAAHYSSDQYWQRAGRLRMEELATEPWPWTFDANAEAVAARIRLLDTEQDLIDALRSVGMLSAEQQEELYGVLHDVLALAAGKARHRVDQLVEAWESRPRLWQAAVDARERMAREEAARRETDPHTVLRGITQIADVEMQAEVLREKWEVVKPVILRGDGLLPEVRDGAFRELKTAKVKGRTSPCPDPNCGGWAPGTSARAVCVKCGQPADQVSARMTSALGSAGRVLRHPGFGVRVEGVVLDLETIELLQSLAAVMDTAGSALVSAAPPELQRRLRRWASRLAPAVLVDVGARPADTDTDTDTDEGHSRIALPALGVMG